MVWQAVDRRTPEVKVGTTSVLTAELRQKIDKAIERYPVRQGALLPALHLVQNSLGYVPPKAIEEIAGILGITPSEIFDAMSCYGHFHTAPRARHLIMVCHGLSCEVCGSAKLLEVLKEKLGIEEGEVTPDGRFSLESEECMGGCDKAPYLTIDWKSFGSVRIEQVDEILSRYK
jgi:NADH-quinone oxidoreductase E subunit